VGRQVAVTATESAPRRLGRRPVLDGMRGIAILLVMLMHTNILTNGYMGVDVFFGLSGFLITTLLLEEWERGRTISLKRFYGRRARRLLPALGVVLLACVVVNATLYTLAGWPLGEKLLTTALFVNNWMETLKHAQLGSLTPTWSLAQEEQFYLLWPVLLLVMLRLRVNVRAIGAVLALMILALLYAEPHVLSLSSHVDYYSPFDRASELLFGALGAVVWHSRLIPSPLSWIARSPRAKPLARTLQRHWRAPVCWLLALAFVWLMFNQTLLPRTIYLGAAAITVPLIINLLAVPESMLARLIACPPLRWIGRISYSLYLYHLLVRNILDHYHVDNSVYLNALITFSASISLATLSWYLLESRVLKGQWLRRARVKAVRGRLELAPEGAQ
jgi:peptidoglycan/LPS O-acetylase OafA/YrhL